MAKTQSRMLALGTAAPDFSLPDPAGKLHRLGDFAGARALVGVMCAAPEGAGFNARFRDLHLSLV